MVTWCLSTSLRTVSRVRHTGSYCLTRSFIPCSQSVFWLSLSRLWYFSYRNPPLTSLLFSTACPHVLFTKKRLLLDSKKSTFLVTANNSHRDVLSKLFSIVRARRGHSTRASASDYMVRKVSPFSLTSHVAHRDIPSVFTSSHPHSLSSFLQQNLVSLHTLQPPSARLSANSSIQTFCSPTTPSLFSQNPAILSLQQQKQVLTNSLNKLKIALRQAEMKTNEQPICT